MKVWLSLIVIITSTRGMAQESPDENWKYYTTKTYTISYPPDWKLDSILVGKRVFSLSREVLPEDPFFESVSYSIHEPEKKVTTLDKLISKTLKSIPEQFNDSEIIESKIFQHHGMECYKIIFYGRLFSTKATMEQWYWMMDGKVHVLTYSGDPVQFKEFQEVGERILASFNLRH